MTTAVLPLARPTFDVAYAEERLAAMGAALDAAGVRRIGGDDLLMDADGAEAALDAALKAGAERLLILQVTFTDAAMTARIAERFPGPLMIWAPPEPRLGGRLRLNAFCGLNLASHALGLRNRPFGWLYADPDGPVTADLTALLAGQRQVGQPPAATAQDTDFEGRLIHEAVAGARIARIGAHPEGFDTCAYDPARMAADIGMSVDELGLDLLFQAASMASSLEVDPIRRQVAHLKGLADVDQGQLEKSLKLKAGLETIRSAGAYDAFALRCWPETFTEYGGAVCGPASMLAEGQIPCACEADVYGAATQILMQAVAKAPVFLVDLVDMDLGDDTGVVWHCGQAPISMADPDHAPEATIHTNRKMPLLFQFPLKPGLVTLARISQGKGETKLILSAGEMLKRPMAFTGTSGVLRFEQGAGAVLNAVMDTGLEHHLCLAYGDHRTLLRSAAGAMGVKVLEI